MGKNILQDADAICTDNFKKLLGSFDV